MAPIEWNEEKAAHLYRRAGFGASAAEIAQSLRDGLDGTVSRLVNYESIADPALETRLSGLGLDLATLQGIARWWVTRMVYSQRPLEERMTFFLHDHFATANSKVGDAGLMLTQNKLLRTHALGNFTQLTIEISRDPAMLVWLDNYQSRKDRPNENYGRELLELFTLGLGHYSERDVTSATKAFTGWTFLPRTRIFTFNDAQHDHSQKDFLGRVGDWNGDDIVRIACGEFAHAQLIAGKLFSYFAYEYPEQEVVNRFAQIYLDSKTNLKTLVDAILRSPEMYSTKAMWSKVKSPVDHTIIATRQLMLQGDVSRTVSSTLNAEGQYPFNPPDVDGWTSGLSWINSGTLLNRMNYGNSAAATVDVALVTAGQTFTTASGAVDFWLRRLGPLTVSSETRTQLEKYVLLNGVMPSGQNLIIKQRGLVHMILSLPEWQMN